MKIEMMKIKKSRKGKKNIFCLRKKIFVKKKIFFFGKNFPLYFPLYFLSYLFFTTYIPKKPYSIFDWLRKKINARF